MLVVRIRAFMSVGTRVTCDVRQVPNSVQETQCIQHGGIDADADIRIAFFDAL
jgi:hypothetical protein